MTVIAVKNGIVCSDSLLTDHNLAARVGTMAKIIRVNGHIAGWAGGAAQGQQFFRWLNGCKEEPDWSNLHGFVLRSDGVLIEFDNCKQPLITNYDNGAAWGSGAAIALGVMMIGGSARDAVEAAIRINLYCGPPLIELSL